MLEQWFHGIYTLEYYSGIIKNDITSHIKVGMVLDRKHSAKWSNLDTEYNIKCFFSYVAVMMPIWI